MKTLVMLGAAAAALAAGAATAAAQECRTGRWSGNRPDLLVTYRHDRTERPVLVIETRTVYRTVVVGYDRCGRPILACRPVCERVPVWRTEWVTGGCRDDRRFGSWGIRVGF